PGSWPPGPTAGRDRRVGGPRRHPIPRGPRSHQGPLPLRRSRARGGETPARAEPPQRKEECGDRRLERADPRSDLPAESELEVLDASELVALGQAPHVVTAHAELLHLHQRMPLEEIKGPLLAVGAAPSAEELPG